MAAGIAGEKSHVHRTDIGFSQEALMHLLPIKRAVTNH
jgi:hypothetical protein